MVTTDSTQQLHSIQINGTELTYVAQGAGDTLLFVHGSLGDFRSWLDQLVPFADRYRTIAYSRRAHYPNAWPADYARCDPEVHAADLAALIEALGTGPAHLFGHSYGALVSLVLAVQRPDLVHTLILGEPPLFNWLDATPEDRALVADFMANAMKPAHRAFAQGDQEAGVRVFLDGVIGEGVFDQIPPPDQAALLDNAPEMAVEAQTPPHTYFSSLAREDVAGLRMPALLLDGEFSPRLFARVNDGIAGVLPDAERVTIPDVSHDLSNPQVFQETLRGFLAKHP
jgi:pimeloyl-ACP methyl ester carboxylesterase